MLCTQPACALHTQKKSLSAAQVLFMLGNDSGDESDIEEDPAFPL